MAKVRRCLLILSWWLISMPLAQLQPPFPAGYAMGNLGTIIAEDAPGGRSAQVPATFLGDSLRWGCTAAAVSYYDAMDNLSDKQLTTISAGAFFAAKKYRVKIAITSFDALGVYCEQRGRISAAYSLVKGVRAGIDLTGIRAGLRPELEHAQTLGEIGFSLWVPLRTVALTSSVNHITVKQALVAGLASPVSVGVGIHTLPNVFGAQGVLFTVTPDYNHPLRVAIGEEIRLAAPLGIHGAVANNPFFIAIGAVLYLPNSAISSAFVNHPQLGWSKGFEGQHGWRRP